MKCIKFPTGLIKRMSDYAAYKMVERHQVAGYVSKSEWKQAGRP